MLRLMQDARGTSIYAREFALCVYAAFCLDYLQAATGGTLCHTSVVGFSAISYKGLGVLH